MASLFSSVAVDPSTSSNNSSLYVIVIVDLGVGGFFLFNWVVVVVVLFWSRTSGWRRFSVVVAWFSISVLVVIY